MHLIKKHPFGLIGECCFSAGILNLSGSRIFYFIMALLVTGCRSGQEAADTAGISYTQQFRNGKLKKMAFLNRQGFSHRFPSGIKLEFTPGIFDAAADDSIFLETADYTSLPEMVLAGLSTTSGDRLLESNGMVWCKAFNQ